MLRFTGVKLELLIISLILIPSLVFGLGVRVTWNKNSENDLAGYLVYCGTSRGSYDRIVGAGLKASVDIRGVDAGRTYYFAVTARDTSGNQSGYSQQVAITIPAADSGNSGTNTGSTGTTGGIITSTDALIGAAVDRVEDFLSILLGHVPDDPLGSLNQTAAQSAVAVQASSLVVNKNGTVADNAQLKDDVETKYPVRDAVLQAFTPFDLATLYPSGMYFFYPLYDACPDIDKDMIIAESPGRFLYMVFNETGDVAHVLRLSIADEIFQLQTYNPGQALFLEDEVYGVAIQIPAGAAYEEKPIAIGWGGTDLFPGSAELARGENAVIFDILPYGLELDEQAVVSVPYSGSQPQVMRYDEKTGAWVAVEDVQSSNGYVSFSTQVLGRFKITQGDGNTLTDAKEAQGDKSACFITAAAGEASGLFPLLMAVACALRGLLTRKRTSWQVSFKNTLHSKKGAGRCSLPLSLYEPPDLA
jgi:hypothetical protein